MSNIKKYCIAYRYTNLRRRINGLVQIISLQYGYEIDENNLFFSADKEPSESNAYGY
jgi:hypothetical protein